MFSKVCDKEGSPLLIELQRRSRDKKNVYDIQSLSSDYMNNVKHTEHTSHVSVFEY